MDGCAGLDGGKSDVYVVRPQDTLYSIAWRYGLDYRDLARWNKIGADFRIRVGQTLTLVPSAAAAPAKTNRLAPPGAATAAATAAPTAATAATPTGSLTATPAAGPWAAPGASSLSWVWPTDRVSAPLAVSGGGILLPGRLGQDIRAASAGRVVYNGTGIRGYGNLIIIKHGENLLSAYAHTREPLVREGQDVTLGQVIGHMGEGAPQKPVLYFEIRRNGKPVDPRQFLPQSK